ncbi:ribokinase [Solibacillus sp. FSL W7-1472]|uniref:Ribokinase n=1 Tax=Solibacillus isronensis B3W22 TaxID=1224748 RepID=K1KV27_9BACL|nr:ribokinase [Solibacillus isronensis]AMO87402.1 ribokinase [Solibacillus silvestris]EKB43727.1 Ribokinase [Solibacillus isronensis B3W22]
MITVIGSINMDLVVQMDVFPKKGETVLGSLFTTVPGGKGANQAVAAARLGSQVKMLGAVGSDSFGTELRANLNEENIDTSLVMNTSGATGIANILLHESDNRIVVVPGANSKVSPEVIASAKTVIENSQLVVMQLEIPVETIKYSLNLCKELQVPVLFNPAPAANFDIEWMPYIKYLTPNETECALLFGDDVEAALEKYPNQLIVTLGEDGARYFDGTKHVHVKGFNTTAVDTTGAGDTFNGAFAHAITNGQSIEEAVFFANIAASLSVEKFGAQGGMPKLEDVIVRKEGAK